MIINEPGLYRLNSDLGVRNAISCGTIPAGTVIRVTQVDLSGHQVIGPDLMDWHYWNIDAQPAQPGEEGKHE